MKVKEPGESQKFRVPKPKESLDTVQSSSDSLTSSSYFLRKKLRPREIEWPTQGYSVG